MLHALWQYRGFVGGSIRRDFRTRYTGSALGALWHVASPLMLIGIYAAVFAGLMRARLPGVDDGLAYAVYVCAGLLPWNMFAEILTRSQTMFVDNANLLKKASFPRSSLPLIAVGNSVVTFSIVFSVFLVLLALAGRFPGAVVAAAVAPVAILVALGAGLGILLGIAHVFFRDVGHALGLLLTVWFWLTPIVYPASILPSPYAQWIAWNPLAPVARALQDIFVMRSPPALASLAFPIVVSLIVLAAAYVAFRRQAPFLVDEL